jgi:hypothetical protein
MALLEQYWSETCGGLLDARNRKARKELKCVNNNIVYSAFECVCDGAGSDRELWKILVHDFDVS